MAKTAAERMASMRERQRRTGLVTLTLVVPAGDANHFRSLAAKRRSALMRDGNAAPFRANALRRAVEPGRARSALSSVDIRRLRELLEVTAVSLVIARLNPRIERRLRALLEQDAALDGDASSERMQRFHEGLGELAGDATLEFLLRIALRVTEQRSTFTRLSRSQREAVIARIRRSRARIASAILARDAPLAERRMRRYLDGLKDWLE
jgi:DNA-binding FadR family transcriptional regulator